MMADFTDVDEGRSRSARTMRMMFRIKEHDTRARLHALFLEGGAERLRNAQRTEKEI